MTDNLYEAIKKSGIKITHVKSLSEMTPEERRDYAERIRKSRIEHLSSSPIRERYFPEEKTERLIELKKYEEMTPKEIIQYEGQKTQERRREFELFIKEKRLAEERARNSNSAIKYLGSLVA